MKWLFTFSFVLIFSFAGLTQTTISGRLQDEKGKPVPRATITIRTLQTDEILSYGISDNKGEFSIKLRSDKNKLQLKIRSMGYKTIVKTIENKSQNLPLILEEEITELKEVIVKIKPINKRGDTINYTVSAFSKQKDRTIADVLKNMPGIEVLKDGKILYQGKSINKYYIEGLDLLEGKYNLANNNLPYKEVLKVQVIENHQPIKMLNNLIYSDKAAINIKLKKTYTFTGQMKMGSGFSPLLWDLNITPMLFSKKKQMISSYQTNNIGKDVASQLKSLTIEDLIEQGQTNPNKQNWLYIRELQPPPFSKSRWLDNNVHLLTINYLHKLKNSYELRTNLSYLNDYQQQKGMVNTQFYIAGDTISLLEKIKNKSYSNFFETNLTLQRNTEENYFKNSLKLQLAWEDQQGNIQLNSKNINQYLKNKYYKLSNNFKTFFKIRKKILTLNSYISYNELPQSLTVKPGPFNIWLNGGNAYNEAVQDLIINTFHTTNSLSFTTGLSRFSFSPELGWQMQQQNLKSQIFTSNTGQISNFDNNLNWLHSKIFFKLQTQYQIDKWRIELNTPINFHHFNVEDSPLNRSQKLNQLTLEPHLSLNYYINNYWRLTSSIRHNKQFGSINQVYYNYILLNYRNLQRIDAPIAEKQKTNYFSYIRYRNPIKALFFNLAYSKTITRSNLLYSIQILNDGFINIEAVEQNNTKTSHNLSFQGSKYFNSINSTITMSADYTLQDYEQILNAQKIDITNQNWSYYTKIDVDITDWLNTEFKTIFQFSNNKVKEQANPTVTQQFYKFNFNIYPSSNQYLSLKTEFVKNNLYSKTSQNFFADLTYRFTWLKNKMDFEIKWNNIFNTKNYTIIEIDNYSYLKSNYALRPRQILFSIRFSL
jgi:hypothetical protein